nr:MAG TPA: hypothetical protein [Caudoviricetes sp.]
MKYIHLERSFQDILVNKRDNYVDSVKSLGVDLRFDLGDIERLDLSKPTEVPTRVEYDSGDYLYLFNGMVNIDNFNMIANYLDMGENVVILNLKEVLEKRFGMLSEKSLKEGLLKFKFTLDFDIFCKELSNRGVQSKLSLFNLLISSILPNQIDERELKSVLAMVIRCMDYAKSYIKEYELVNNGVDTRYNKFELDNRILYNSRCMYENDAFDSYSTVERMIKYTSHYSSSNPFTFNENMERNIISDLSLDVETDPDNYAIRGNIIEIAKVIDGDMSRIIDSSSKSVINEYVPDFDTKYKDGCVRILNSHNNFFRNNQILTPYTEVRGKTADRVVEPGEKNYQMSLDLTSISNIIQDFKSLLKAINIMTIER